MENTPKLKVFISDTHNPWFNLATEDWIFRDMDPNVHVLFLWRNSETVVIGRFQNPWTECRVAQMEADGVKLARRQSGGGAVFHDLGNTNFTFMSGLEFYDKARNNKIITEALNRWGITAYPSGRNDILVDDVEGPKKISGSAFKQTKDRAFHHGTLLINADLSRLANYLQPDERKLTSKGITSVRARVANLTQFHPELNHENLSQEIIAQFFKTYGSECEVIHLKNEILSEIEPLKKYYDFLCDWDWRFGETPQFSHQFNDRLSFGGMEVHLDVHKGVIEQAVIFSDSLHPEMIEQLATALKGKAYHSEGLEQACAQVTAELPMVKEEMDEFCAWCSKQIS